MKMKKPIGIIVLSVIGILYGLALLTFGIMMLTTKGKLLFLDLFEVPFGRFCIIFSTSLLLGSCFTVSSLALLKKWMWGKNLYLFATLFNLILEGYMLFRGLLYGRASTPDLESLFEFCLVLVLSLVIFWYFSRKDIVEYLSFERNTKDKRWNKVTNPN